MKRLIVLSLLLFSSCATTIMTEQPLKYSYLPQKIDLDSLMPIQTKIVDSSLKDFESISLDSGRLVTKYKDTLNIHPGVLISEKKAALFIYYKNNNMYLDKKYTLSNLMYCNLYDRSLDAEKTYQSEIKNLKKIAERSWLEKNIVYFGFLAGLTTAILTEFAVLQSK
jgi:hypothetical protein